MVLYSWKKIYKFSGGNARIIVNILEYLLDKPIPKNRRDKYFKISKHDFRGYSFLSNPRPLLESDASNREKAEYMALASFRSLGNFAIFKDSTLDLSLSPVGEDIINNNSLLYIQDGKIHFKYEEAIGEKHGT